MQLEPRNSESQVLIFSSEPWAGSQLDKSSTHDKFLDLTKFKAFADNKSYVGKITISLLDTVENN